MRELNDIDVQEIAESGTTVVITHPYAGNPIGMEVDIVGLDSEAAQAVFKRQRNRALDRQAKRKALSPEEQDQEVIEIAVAITTGWRSWDESQERDEAEVSEWIPWNGEELKCTDSAKHRVYRKHRWIAGQVIEAAGDKSRFLAE
ncbi:MAG: hypothetical protein WD492_12935 [Alkalispirochaeta sp.]